VVHKGHVSADKIEMVCDMPHWKKNLIFMLVHHKNVNVMCSNEYWGYRSRSCGILISLVWCGSFKELWQLAMRYFSHAVKLESELYQIHQIWVPWFHIYRWTTQQTVTLNDWFSNRKKGRTLWFTQYLLLLGLISTTISWHCPFNYTQQKASLIDIMYCRKQGPLRKWSKWTQGI
jgi:hypothetical protein